MTRSAFAAEVGCTPSYVSQLCRDTPPWPGRALQLRIAEATDGFVSPNDWAGVADHPPEHASPGDSAGPPPL